MGDLHLTASECLSERVAHRFLSELEHWVRPDFVQFAGDNAQEAQPDQFKVFQELRGRLTLENYSLVGDHDLHEDPAGQAYRQWVGEPCGELRKSGYRFLRLNSLDPHPLGFSETQLDWVERQSGEAEEASEHLVWLQHHYPFKVCEAYQGPGLERWRQLVDRHRPLAIFCGHTHYGQVANDGRQIYVASRSIGDPEGGPPAYTLAHFRSDQLALAVRQADQVGPIVLITSPVASILATRGTHLITQACEVEVRVWSESPIVEVRGQVVDQPWLTFVEAGNGYWLAPLDPRGWVKGIYRITVSAHAQDGTVGSQTIDFRYDPTGRLAAVPRVHPEVIVTEFC